MAMNRNPRGLAASRPVYEEFRPQIQTKDERQANTVEIRLPGFLKEQLRIVANTNRGILRVSGERPLAGGKWSRFVDEVPVPEHCNMTETKARFEGGVLRITMPKQMITPSPQFSSRSPSPSRGEPTTPKKSPPAPPRPAPPPQAAPPRPVVLPPPQPVTPIPAAFPTPQPVVPRPAAPLPEQPAAQRPAAPPSPQPAATRLTPSSQRKPREDAKPISSQALPAAPPQSPRPTRISPPPQPEVARRTRPVTPPPKSQPTQMPPPPVTLPPVAKPTSSVLHPVPRPEPEARKDSIAWEKRRAERQSTLAPWDRGGTHQATESWAGGGGGGGGGVSEAKERVEEEENYRKSITGVYGRRLEEERKLLVNMGAAALVIAALGAWISYSLGVGSSAKSTN